MFFVWGVVARLLEKKSRPFLITQRVSSLCGVCVWCCEKLNCCVLKEEENFIRCCFKTKQTKKKEETKKKQKRDYSFCKITLKTIDYREDDDEDHLDEDDEEDYYYS
jgi:hypothetical protein